MDSDPFVGKHVLDLKKLRPGDIILSRESWSTDAWIDLRRIYGVLKSGIIRLGSKDYSHAMLYFEGSIIHAHPPIVFASNPQRFCAANEGDYRCLRFPALTEKQERQIESYAREHVGALYSTWEAAKTPLKKRGHGHSTSGREFCSRFVAEAYAEAGISLVPNPSFCAPGDFLKAGNLQDMGSCTRDATEEDCDILLSRDFPLLSQKRACDWIVSVRALARRDNVEIKTLNSIFEYVLCHNNRDGEVETLLLQSHYLDTWKEDADAHKYRYFPMEFAALLAANYKTAVSEVVGMFACVGRYGDELLKFDSIKGTSLTMGRIAKLYRDMIRDNERRLSALITLCTGKPGVGPLTRLFAMCSHLLAGTYKQHYSQCVSEEANKLKEEWVKSASEWGASILHDWSHLEPQMLYL